MKYLSALILVSLLLSCRTNVLNEEKSFRVDNGQFSFSASKEKFQLADFKVDDEVVSVVSSIEDSLVLVGDNGEEKELNWRPFKPLHDKFTLIYNQSVDEPNLKFTRSIYVDQKKSQVKIRYNLKNRSRDGSVSINWFMIPKLSSKKVLIADEKITYSDNQTSMTIDSKESSHEIKYLISKDNETFFVELLRDDEQSKRNPFRKRLTTDKKPGVELAPLNRISWQVTLDIKSLKKEPWWKIF